MNDQDLFEKVKEQEKADKTFTLKISPIMIHLSILLLLGLVIYFVFISGNDFESKEELNLVLIGDIDNFSKEYSGDIFLYSSYYNLKTQNGEFDGENTKFSLQNFSGKIFTNENESIIFEGTSPLVHFGSNKLNLNNEKFILTSSKKTTFDLKLTQINLKFNEGRIKFAEELNNDFINTSIIVNNYNASITYDGTFSFKGISGSFNLKNNERNLQIIYN